jgi:hypothetical protein
MPQRSHPAVSRDFPPSPATGEQFKLGHYRHFSPLIAHRFQVNALALVIFLRQP